ncbi:MAG: 3-dehydroquinate synthase [Bacteroidia bacterium]
MSKPIIIGDQARAWLTSLPFKPSDILVLTDEHTSELCYPLLKGYLPEHHLHSIPAGEKFKNLRTCEHLWSICTLRRMDRKGLIINLGGGVLGDMGGFVAATYKRGISFIQVPTTLLAMVDASVGGKLGVDFNGFKNHIGFFQEPEAVLIWPDFLKTLPEKELRSGYAEVLKHCLIADADAWEAHVQKPDWKDQDWEEVVRHSVAIKSAIVEKDMREQGARMALNFGHTIGHAIETWHLLKGRPILHGEAVGLGMIAESWISLQRGLISEAYFTQIKSFLKSIYNDVEVNLEDVDGLWNLALQDKKNLAGSVRCTLLNGKGGFSIKQEIDKESFAKAILELS